MAVTYTFDQLCSVNRDRPARQAVRKAIFSLQPCSPRSQRIPRLAQAPERWGKVNNNKQLVRVSKTDRSTANMFTRFDACRLAERSIDLQHPLHCLIKLYSNFRRL